MDWENILTYAVIGLAVGTAVQYMNKAASRPVPPDESGEFQLRINRIYSFIGLLPLLMALAFIGIIIFTDSEDAWIGALMIVLFAGLGTGIMAFHHQHRLRFNDERIVVQSWLGRSAELTWAEISEITFNGLSGYVTIKGAGKKLRIHQHFVGLVEFARKMEEKTRWTARELKLPVKCPDKKDR